MLDVIFCFGLAIIILFEIYKKDLDLDLNKSFQAGYNFASQEYAIYGEISLSWLEAIDNPFDRTNFSLGVMSFLRGMNNV